MERTLPKKEPAAEGTHSLVASANWEGQDISGQQHTGVDFVDLNVMEAHNNGAVFTDCIFRRARFNVSVHKQAAFVNCTFKYCNFFDAKFEDCKFVGSVFTRCTYDLMEISGGNWSFVALPGADLRKAVLKNVKMREADFTGVQAEDGVIRDCDLSGAMMHSAKLSNCDLRGSDVSSIEPQHTELKGAVVTYNQAVSIAMAFGLDVRDE